MVLNGLRYDLEQKYFDVRFFAQEHLPIMTAEINLSHICQIYSVLFFWCDTLMPRQNEPQTSKTKRSISFLFALCLKVRLFAVCSLIMRVQSWGTCWTLIAIICLSLCCTLVYRLRASQFHPYNILFFLALSARPFDGNCVYLLRDSKKF